MPDPEKEKLDVELEPDTVVDGEAPAKEIELEKPKETPKPEEKPQVDLTEVNKALKRMEYQARQFEKKSRELEELKATLSNIRVTTDAPQTEMDELDEIAQKDWKKAVRKLAEEEAKRILQETYQEQDRKVKEQSLIRELESSKQKVRERYPQIEDENSEESHIYMEVLNESPHLLQNPYGPELAMHRMEEKLRAQGRITPQVKEVVDKELSRRARVGAGALPQGRSGAKTNTYTLTQDQKAYCDHNGISYEVYARTAKQLETGEGLEA